MAELHPLLQQARLLAFDLDGTLIDSVPDLALAIDLTLAELDLPAAGETQVRRWVGNGSLKLLQRALTGGIGQEHLLPDDDPTLAQAHSLFLDIYDSLKGEQTRLYPGVRETLITLRGMDLKLALVTNKPYRFVPGILEHFGLEHTFDQVLGGDSLPQKKPDPAPLLHLARHFQLSPTVCALIGDSRHDIQAARAAGFISVGVPYGYNHGEPLDDAAPDLMIDSLNLLLDNQGFPA
ncbi:phosphoglycolate phosphatase [Marinospirillum alkaliphilum]|uniref:Phosphoglycolate phosphatase n=1 Tax=Marinospirillum alkaliphilum DSM 21637 TaxID=1122209 RepID=A0A1K1VGT9_9GAMM|nr:phosphoglycolate phosphatase [Marinospirillum alkaliphilum DSM 21637]